jgi:hypothetical protein
VSERESTSESAGQTADEDEPLTRGAEADVPEARSERLEQINDEDAYDLATERSDPDARAPSGEEGAAPLLPGDEAERFEQRWDDIQAKFVDEPRESVEQADMLVADLMQRISAGFSSTRSDLEGQWDRGDDVSTEELRVALTRYRSFFNRLLSA